jgi:[ribosomal protein S5]-alanine N-acetyltransferase
MNHVIETERLLLRELVPADAEGMFALDSDAEVHRYLGNKPVKTIAEARATIEFIRGQYVQNGIGRWAMVEKSSSRFIGWTGLKLIREKVNGHIDHYDLGYRLIKEYWGKGYASEAAIACVNYAFEQLRLDAVYATAHPDNLASQKVLEKTGLQLVEIFDDNGEPTKWFSRMRDSWKPLT